MSRATYTGPAHPIGYVEAQRSWVGVKTPDEMHDEIESLRAQMRAEHPGLTQYSARLEETVDGAGVPHVTLYMGFAPPLPAAEPLNPHNMNEAPHPNAGWPEPTDGILPLGSREQKF